MKEPTKEEFTRLIMNLITSEAKMELVLSRSDFKEYQKLIEILKFYRQFADND